jgi:hypothetical protein
MLLGALAALIFFACAVEGLLLLRRRLPAAELAANGHPVCLACRAAASRLSPDSFLCPSCRRDVRIHGLAPIPAGAYDGPVWRVLTFSVILCVLALVATALAHAALPRIQQFSSDTTIHLPADDFRSIQLTAHGRRAHPDPRRRAVDAELHAHLLLNTGDLFTLEVQSPSLQYRVIDADEREVLTLSPPGAFDESAVIRWMSAAGLDPQRPDVQLAAREAYIRIRQTLHVPPENLPRLPRSAEALRNVMGGVTMSGGSSASAGPPDDVLLHAVIFWSVLWLAGVAYILRRRPSPEPTPAPNPPPP